MVIPSCDLPSALEAEERMTALMGLPSRMASSSRFMYTALTASPRAYPSAEASKDFDEPSGERVVSKLNEAVSPGAKIRLVPATTADEIVPWRIASKASWKPTPADEQAVLYVTLYTLCQFIAATARQGAGIPT